MQSGEGIGLGDFLLIAEQVLDVPAADLVATTRIASAESALAAPHATYGGVEFYPDPAERAAILCSRIIRNHPLPDGNKRVGYLCLRESLVREGLDWCDPDGGQDETADVIEALAASEFEESEFVAWVQARVAA